MSASEFAFLALGLLLGVASGAAIVEVLRSRPPAPREIRVTVTPGSVPARSATLAADPFAAAEGPAPLGPADRRLHDRPEPDDGYLVAPMVLAASLGAAAVATGPRRESGRVAVRSDAAAGVEPTSGGATDRTPVPSPGRAAVPLLAGGGFLANATDLGGGAVAAVAERPLVGIPILPEADDRLDDLRPAVAVGAVAAIGASAGGNRAVAAVDASDAPSRAATAEAGRSDAPMAIDPERAPGPTTDGTAGAAGAGAPSPSPVPTGPCGELMVVAEDRCAVAERAREGALAAADAYRGARRAHDDHLARADEADARSDPRAVRAAKEAAQATFRLARDTAADRAALDAAAAAWLAEVNRINLEARDGAARAARERSAAGALVTVIERLEAEAAASRVSAESAHEACLAARQAVADCQERVAATRAAEAQATAAATTRATGGPGEAGDGYPEDEPELRPAEGGPGARQARILRMLEGDGDAVRRTAAELGEGDPDAVGRWQLAISGLLDAITAQAIDASAVDLPEEHPFWGMFSGEQRREILAALASLGHHYDGLGGFADGRVPSQRDLSLAVGYAGLDPMRIRRWPTETELPELLAAARVDAAGYLVARAGSLTLGEIVALLDRRADALTDVWNDWGRLRPLLLAVD